MTPDAVAHARELVGLAAPDRALAGGLDTLERRKLLLACLLQRPASVLLMDEPCSGLLADEIDEIDAVIRRIVEERGCAVVVVEHRLELLFAIAKRVVVLDAGSVIADGPANEVFELPDRAQGLLRGRRGSGVSSALSVRGLSAGYGPAAGARRHRPRRRRAASASAWSASTATARAPCCEPSSASSTGARARSSRAAAIS